jgi:hypothetical protein
MRFTSEVLFRFTPLQNPKGEYKAKVPDWESVERLPSRLPQR